MRVLARSTTNTVPGRTVNDFPWSAAVSTTTRDVGGRAGGAGAGAACADPTLSANAPAKSAVVTATCAPRRKMVVVLTFGSSLMIRQWAGRSRCGPPAELRADWGDAVGIRGAASARRLTVPDAGPNIGGGGSSAPGFEGRQGRTRANHWTV